jgi:SET domain-containing protein
MSNKLPHFGVYARIGRSKIHGVGIIAIRRIQKGTHIFFPDNDKLCWVKASKITRLPREIRKLYKDFCIKKGGKYGCPINFNKLSPAWYLNHSKDPNVVADSSYRFYAVKNIKKGDELTANYNTYSE